MKSKNLFLFFAVAIIISLSSCGGKMSTFAYNERIVAMHNTASDFLNSRMEVIYAHEISKEEASKIVDSMKMKYDKYLNELTTMQIPDKAEGLNNSCIQLFTYVRDSVIPLYSETLNFAPESEGWYKVWNEIDKRLNNEGCRASQLEDKMIREQEEFAAATGNKLNR